MNRTGPLHISNAAAILLLETGCLRAHTDRPLQFRSGLASPVAIDTRQLLFYPLVRDALVELGVIQLMQAGVLGSIDAVACGESNGLVLASDLARQLELPVVQVHLPRYRAPTVDGLRPNIREVLLVDDFLISGRSKLACAQALRERGLRVAHAFTLFDLGLGGATESLEAHGISVHALTRWQNLLETAGRTSKFDPSTLRSFGDFVRDPVRWSADHRDADRAEETSQAAGTSRPRRARRTPALGAPTH